MAGPRSALRLGLAIALVAVAALAVVAVSRPRSLPAPYRLGGHVRVVIEAPERMEFEADASQLCDVFDGGMISAGIPNGVDIVGRVMAFPIGEIGSTEFGVGIELIEPSYMDFPIYGGNGYRGGTLIIEPKTPDRRFGQARFEGLRSDDFWLVADHLAPLAGTVSWECTGPASTFSLEGAGG